MPMGTLMRKMRRQEATETMAPPMVGPHMEPRAVKVPMRPSARPRFSANISVMMPWLLAMLAATPRPWMARAAMRTGRLGARALRTEPTVKVATPTWKTRTLPTMSPRRPKVSRKAQLTTKNVLETHWTSAMSTSKACWRVGSATLAMVVSSISMNVMHSTTMSAAFFWAPRHLLR